MKPDSQVRSPRLKTPAMRPTPRLPGASRRQRHGRNCIVCTHQMQNDGALETIPSPSEERLSYGTLHTPAPDGGLAPAGHVLWSKKTLRVPGSPSGVLRSTAAIPHSGAFGEGVEQTGGPAFVQPRTRISSSLKSNIETSGQFYTPNCSSSALASCKSGVSKPSVNKP
jgi:hypothetical protein